MQISGLPASSTFAAADVLAIEINGVTYKITGATLAAALQSMGDYVTAQDIVNNLTTTDEGYVLDARQGKALLDAIEALGATVEELGDPVEVAHGGTGTGTAPTPGGVIYGASGTAFGSTPAGTAGQFLRSNGANAPEWATVDKSTVGLGNVDNTSDMDKPVSTAQQAAIDAAEATLEGAIDTVEATLESAVDGKAGMIYEDASGSIVSFQDGADGGVVKALVIGIQPAQEGSGDPSPENVRALSGWTGANVTGTGENIFGGALMRDGIKASMPSAVINEEEKYVSFSANATVVQTIDTACGLAHKYKESTVYTFILTIYKASVLSSNLRVYYTDGSYTNVPAVSEVQTKEVVVAVTSAGKTVDHFSKIFTGGTMRVYYDESGVFEGDLTAGDFAPYAGSTHPVTWGAVAGTVYGGSVALNQDGSADVSACPYYASYSGQALVGPWVSSMDVYAAGATPTTGAQVVDLGGAKTVYHVPDAWTPPILTLLGENDVFADCGPIDALTYPADTKLYIQKINAPTDDDMTADTQIASGQYFIINGNLYRSTTTIPAGDTINPGTNCVLTNLADALNALNT